MRPKVEAAARATRAHDPACLLGTQIGPYRVIGWLGSGGMGNVYEVEHVELGRHFALKALRSELAQDAEAVARFEREPRAAAKLISDHVVSIVGCGSLSDGIPYFVMERLYGRDLRRLLDEQGTLPLARTAHIGLDAALGLSCAHDAGLVHRDLKPENLFITTGDDGHDICKLLDFGVAKSKVDNTTGPGALIGTARYMAPEQVGLDIAVSAQTDLFALGAILYECLVGRPPFDGDTLERVLFKIMSEPQPPLLAACPGLPQSVAELIERAMCKRPADRPASARAFAEALLPHARPGAVRTSLSSWQLEVSGGATPVTPFGDTGAASAPSVLAAAPSRRAVLKRSSSLIWVVTLAAVAGLGLGALGSRAWYSAELAPPGAPKPARAPDPEAVSRSASAPEPPAPDTSLALEPRAPERAPEASHSAHQRSVIRSLERTVIVGSPPSPPPPTYDAHNPYAE